MLKKMRIPVIDLFAGPGGLGEGFSSLPSSSGGKEFSLKVSIEKDPIAYLTLSLRALYRSFPKDKVPDCYFQYVRGEITRSELFEHPDIPKFNRDASSEAKLAELGTIDPDIVDGWIAKALGKAADWVLIGGPPCQAYSLAGRSRRTRENLDEFEKDVKHFLYREYLRIIRRFRPSIFVMENVKGILSSQHSGSRIFERILSDLKDPSGNLSYEIRSFVVPGGPDKLVPRDYVIESERFGVPQSRHRVILFGIRSDVAKRSVALARTPKRFTIFPTEEPVSVQQVLNDLPRLRSRLSQETDSPNAWQKAIAETSKQFAHWKSPARKRVEDAITHISKAAVSLESSGGRFISEQGGECLIPRDLKSWYLNRKLKGVLQHESRSHMRSDLHRYLFAATYAKEFKSSPKLALFPPKLLPNHDNVNEDYVPFADRFRVQMAHLPSSTVVAHISKDGHYFIHPDPAQCRSLTVREAARLQTFPDDYFFEGNRTEQYTQVGNAVPPWLARKIAAVVLDLLTESRNPKPARKNPLNRSRRQGPKKVKPAARHHVSRTPRR